KLKLTVNQNSPRIIYHPYDFYDSNYKVSATFNMKEDDDVFGIILRYKDNLNYYYVGYNSALRGGGVNWGEDKIRLIKVVDGVSTTIAQSKEVVGWELNTDYRFEAEVVGDKFHVYLDEELVLTATD